MGGPTLVIELAEAVPDAAIQRLRGLLARSSELLREKRPGDYAVNVFADRLGIADTGGADERRSFLVSLMGPGIGDEGTFEAEHADGPELEAVIGFKPTHAIDVIACCNSPVDHTAAALLTAALMDVVGGVAHAELHEDQMSVVDGLPGVVATLNEPWPAVFGTAQFLRAWSAQPGFRLVK
jgi:hypothetical protein